MSEIKMLPLPQAEEWEDTTAWAKRYARAVAEHNVRFLTHELANAECAIDAEQAGRKKAEAEIEALKSDLGDYMDAANYQAARAERLAEALRGLKDLMLGQVKWEPCDCGCPQKRTPDGPHSATWLRAAQQVEIAISKAEGKE